MFKEDKLAEIQVAEIMLEALEKKKKEVEPLLMNLVVEIGSLKEDIKRMKEKLSSEK